jgi:hypothetical protein
MPMTDAVPVNRFEIRATSHTPVVVVDLTQIRQRFYPTSCRNTSEALQQFHSVGSRIAGKDKDFKFELAT